MATTPPVIENPQPSAAATPVTDKRTAATGAIPKQMQSWIFLAIIGVVAVGLWFSSSGQKVKSAGANGPATGEQVKPIVGGLTADEVQRRVQESEEARRTALNNPVLNQPGRPAGSPSNEDATLPGANQPAPPATPVTDPIAEDERKREYVSRFASNVAVSYRTDPHAGNSGAHLPARMLSASSDAEDPASSGTQPQNLPGLPGNFQQQLEALQSQQEKLLAQQQQLAAATALPAGSQPPQPQQAPATASSTRKNVDVNAATGKDHVIFEGTVLESVLVNRLNGGFAGPVICQITNDLYSHDHLQLLIPAGARVLGETKKVSDVGQARMAVVFHRLIMPDGYAVDLDQAPGLNQIGETALHDKVNNHYFKIFGSSIAVGAIAGLASIGSNNNSVTGLPTSNISAYREGVSGSLSQSSLRILDKFLNIPPTITIREGHRVRIFLTQDLLVPAYAQHKMPSDL
jgi:type IV secretory pathway VirB10-like protein